MKAKVMMTGKRSGGNDREDCFLNMKWNIEVNDYCFKPGLLLNFFAKSSHLYCTLESDLIKWGLDERMMTSVRPQFLVLSDLYEVVIAA